MTSLPHSYSVFFKQFGALFLTGLLGIVAIAPTAGALVQAQLAQTPGAPDLSLTLLMVLAIIQPTILLAAAVGVGIPLAARLGLRSHVATRASHGTPFLAALRAEFPLAVALGAGTSLITLGLDALIQPWLPEALAAAGSTPRSLSVTLAGVFYGGLTEELMLRWGFMSLLAGIIWRLAQRDGGAPRPGVMWAAIIGATVLFGLGHLPATAAIAPLTPLVIVRAVVLNGLAGVVFGWLYWRRSLESAMLAHATAHIVFTLVSWAATLV